MPAFQSTSSGLRRVGLDPVECVNLMDTHDGRRAAGEFFAAAPRTPSSLVQFLSDLRWRSELRLKVVFFRDQYGFAG